MPRAFPDLPPVAAAFAVRPSRLLGELDLEASRLDARIRIAEGETARLTEARDAALPQMLARTLK